MNFDEFRRRDAKERIESLINKVSPVAFTLDNYFTMDVLSQIPYDDLLFLKDSLRQAGESIIRMFDRINSLSGAPGDDVMAAQIKNKVKADPITPIVNNPPIGNEELEQLKAENIKYMKKINDLKENVEILKRTKKEDNVIIDRLERQVGSLQKRIKSQDVDNTNNHISNNIPIIKINKSKDFIPPVRNRIGKRGRPPKVEDSESKIPELEKEIENLKNGNLKDTKKRDEIVPRDENIDQLYNLLKEKGPMTRDDLCDAMKHVKKTTIFDYLKILFDEKKIEWFKKHDQEGRGRPSVYWRIKE
jgi:predicted RNase H-like nuclease (RuvC/YqgF family)